MTLTQLRHDYHQRICQDIVRIQTNRHGIQFPNFADGNSQSSRQIAQGMVQLFRCTLGAGVVKEQTMGARFEKITASFLEQAFELLRHLRPGRWGYAVHGDISSYVQYEHLAEVERIVRKSRELASALGREYVVKPDIVVGRYPVADQDINAQGEVVGATPGVASLTPFREANNRAHHQLLHACISCKWTVRSDRAQNTRTEALNLIRYRKGHVPHVVAVTAEPLPTRIAALALGTGDLDCVYHFALHELEESLAAIQNADQQDMLNMLVGGRRLRDISDLPFDLIA